jgi:DNA repair protein RadA/Sms
MPSDRRSVYRCSDCGTEYPKWAGRCDACGSWNTLAEEIVARRAASRLQPGGVEASAEAVRLGDVLPEGAPRITTSLGELDFVLGGGIVPGSLILVGGEPGIGKSTILLQCAGRVEAAGVTTLYASGEESVNQVGLRAARLEEPTDGVHVLPEVRIDAITARAAALGAKVVIVDSIQTTYTDELVAKETGTAVILVGHVTRGGGIAGPKTLEHVVDTVLYFEGDASNDFRILRAVKNRFGSVDEVGIFEMTATGLCPVVNPSAAFLSGRDETSAGSAVTALMEGTRPVLVEIQALAAKAGFATPQRVATGLDHKRLAVLLAVMERRAGIPFHDLDVFLNVTGGVRLVETASDLGVAAALLSSVNDVPCPADTLFVGEVGLGGEVRPVPGTERRLAEAERLGFRKAIVSARGAHQAPIQTVSIKHVSELHDKLAA